MIDHTMFVSFNAEIPAAELDQYLSEMEALTLAAGLGPRFAVQRHIPIPADEHASVFVPTVVVQFTATDAEALNSAFSAPELGEFIGRWQGRYPYRVVWANHAPLV